MNIETTFWTGILFGGLVYTTTDNHELGLMACGLCYIAVMIALVIGCAVDNINDR